MVYGVQCVTMAGTAMMPPQSADNWDTTIVCCVLCIHRRHFGWAQAPSLFIILLLCKCIYFSFTSLIRL